MKRIDYFINEKLKMSTKTIVKSKEHHYFPETKNELKELVKQLMKER